MARLGSILTLVYVLLAVSILSATKVAKRSSKNSGVPHEGSKCHNMFTYMIHNSFYKGASKEFKALLLKVRNELSEISEEITSLKGNNTIVYKNCADLYSAGEQNSGVYRINPDNGNAFDVFCDQKTSGGGWTVFQKRLDGSVDFNRGWDDYKRGFGNLNGEFWLGLDKIHRLTQKRSRLRVDLEDTTGKTAYAEYDLFGVSSERSKYRLSLGTYSGSAGDSLSYHSGRPFSTKDQDNDIYDSGSCAVAHKGGWWYGRCADSSLNGFYYHGSYSNKRFDGAFWLRWMGYHYSAKRTEMKIRPVNA